MRVQAQIQAYMSALPEKKCRELQELHRRIRQIKPGCKLWFLDGKNESGKIVSNPSIGYGTRVIRYADGKTKEFYQVGLSANTTGISVYVMGIEDKTYLAGTFGGKLGKAHVTGYCIRFKTLADIHVNVLEEAIQFGFENT